MLAKRSRWIRTSAVALWALLVVGAATPAVHAWETEVFRGRIGRADWVLPAPNGDIFVLGKMGDQPFLSRVSSDGKPLWRARLSDSPNYLLLWGEPAVDANGDVIAVGQAVTPPSTLDFAVVKLSGTTGEELWRYVSFDGPTGWGLARSVAADAAGNVIVTGAQGQIPDPHFVVAKLNGADGSQIWRFEHDVSGSHNYGFDVGVSPDGKIVAAGIVDDAFGAFALDAGNGSELWRATIPQSGVPVHFITPASSIVFDAAADVIVGGTLEDGSNSGVFGVAKLAGTDGTVLWRTDVLGTDNDPTYPTGGVLDLDIDASGNPIAAGQILNLGSGTDFAVVKLAGATGAEVWRHEIAGSEHPNAWDSARRIAVLSSGDVAVAGSTNFYSQNNDPGTSLVLRLGAADGHEIWRRSFVSRSQVFNPYVPLSRPNDMVLGADGDVVLCADFDHYPNLENAGGDSLDTGSVIKVSADNGADIVAGDRLAAKQAGANLRLSVKAKVGIAISLVAEANPTLSAGLLELRNPITGESTSLPLTGAWTIGGGSQSPRSYQYGDSNCRIAVRVNSSLAIKCRSLPGFSLDESSQGSLAVRLTTGSGPGSRSYCAVFTGERDQPGIFRGGNSPAPVACPFP